MLLQGDTISSIVSFLHLQDHIIIITSLSFIYNQRMLDQAIRVFLHHNRYRAISLSIAALAVSAALTSIYAIYKRVNLPPRALRHIPQVSAIQLIMAQMQLKSIREIAFTTTLPAASDTEYGMYLVVSLISSLSGIAQYAPYTYRHDGIFLLEEAYRLGIAYCSSRADRGIHVENR